MITFHNGSRLQFRSFDKPKFMRGMRRINEVWIDEIHDIKESDFWPIIRPLISDARGTIVVSGQFRGLTHWTYTQCFEPGQKAGQNYFKSWRFPSSTGLAFQSDEGKLELARTKEQMPKAVFDQEFDCIPTANQAAVFRTEDLREIMRGATAEKPRQEPNGTKYRYIIGYDLGEMVDPSAIVILEYETLTVVHAELVPLRVKHQVQARNLAELARKWNAQVVIDATGGGTGGKRLADETVRYYRDVIPDLKAFVWVQPFKKEMVRVLSLAVENHTLSVPEALKGLHEEMASYEFEYKAGEYDYHGPDGKKDNLIAGLLMAVYAAKAGYVKTPGGPSLGAAFAI